MSTSVVAEAGDLPKIISTLKGFRRFVRGHVPRELGEAPRR
jgi:hypothetical protein